MFHRSQFVFLIGLLTLPLCVSGQNAGGFHPQNSSYLWPTDASHYLSSTFAETRSQHFHAALDLKTWGQRGYNVYATRDGVLHRIAIGPTGYGKVIYLRHDDGSYSIYAHLLRFEKSIQQLADSIRFRDYSFEIDRVLDSLRIEVEQGDLIGISGASGIGPPHLHFELRTPSDKPFNPLLTNLKIQDTIPPEFSRLSVEPLSMFSGIEGRHQLHTRHARKIDANSYSFSTVDTEGPVGLGVAVFDQADNVHNAYAVYELKMYVDGQLFFYSKADSFSYHETDQLFLDRVYPILKKTRAGFQRLYIADGNTLPFYRDTGRAGRLDLPAGTHQVRIVASDFYGNTSEASLRLRVHPPDTRMAPAPNRPVETGLPELLPANWTWFGNWVHIPSPALSGLTVTPLDSPAGTPVAAERSYSATIDLTKSRDVFFRRTARDHFIARRVYPGSFSIVPATTHEAFAAFDSGAVYDTLSAGITSRALRADSVRVQVFPASQPIRKPFMLAYALDSTQTAIPNLAFYAYNKRKNELDYLTTQKNESYLIAYPDKLGTFYALSDTVSPVLQKPRLLQRPDGQWVMAVKISDNLSGIDHTRSEFYVNNVRGIAEYAPEDDRLVYYHPDFVPRTSNILKVVVYDRLGNRREKEFILDAGYQK